MEAVQVAHRKPEHKVTLNLPRRVQATLDDFQQQLLELFPDDLLQIILYGSYARGEATPDSDVDVMVVVNWRDVDQWREASIVDAAASSFIAHGAFISPLVFNERQFNSNRPVVNDAKQGGIVLWRTEGWIMSSEKEELPADPYQPQTWIDLAETKLDNARQVFKINIYSATVSLAYYAMFYACRAALLTKGLYLKKHSAAADKFRELFVHTGEVDRRYVTYLSRTQTAREKSDYEPFRPLSREDAADVLSTAETFIARMRELIGEKQG